MEEKVLLRRKKARHLRPRRRETLRTTTRPAWPALREAVDADGFGFLLPRQGEALGLLCRSCGVDPWRR